MDQRAVSVVNEPERIVSLLASGTELLCALGLGDKLVGRSHECDYPAWVRRLPEVSRPTFDISGTSREIDELVRTRLRACAPLYQIDEALLLTLAPDLLVTQTHCEVCAVSPADFVHHLPAKLTRRPVVALSGGTIAAILEGFSEVAKAVGRPEAGVRLVNQLRARVAAVRERVAGLPRPRVICLEWIEPPFAMGNWGPELVELAGGESLLGAVGAHSTTTPWQAVLDADPDVLVISPCGFGLARAQQEMPLIANLPGYANLAAARADKVFVADGNLYFNRSSPSLFETPEILAEMLHPLAFEPRHEGTAWRRFSAG
jgi:iron complex transport system substrate-binding protein